MVGRRGSVRGATRRAVSAIGSASMLHVLILGLSLKPGRMPPPARQRPVSMTATLGEKDVAELLSGKEYAMDISSITEGSEKETYIGQGSGVNAGTGIGALAGWVKGLVGKYLARKNRPVYEDLWQIIEGDLLTMVQEHEPALEQRRTWFTEPGDAPAAHTFATADGKCEGTVAAYKGGRVDWITTCKFFSSELGFGNLRIDGWATRAPLPRSPGPRTGRPTSLDTCLFSSAPELPLAHSRACLLPSRGGYSARFFFGFYCYRLSFISQSTEGPEVHHVHVESTGKTEFSTVNALFSLFDVEC